MKHYYGLIFLIALLFFSFISEHATAQIDTVALTVTPPADTVGMCRDNLFSITFDAQGLHEITIDAKLYRNGFIDTIFNCSDLFAKPKLFIVLDSVNTTLSNITTDTIAGTWTAALDTTATVTIWYHVYLDCSSLSLANENDFTLSLMQTFYDANAFYYNTGTGTNIWQTNNIRGIRFIAGNNLQFGSSYLDTTIMEFMYSNPSEAGALITFVFTPDTTSYCGMVTNAGLEYAIGTGGAFVPLTPDTPITAYIDSLETLVVRQKVVVNTCITNCPDANVCFRWHCAQWPATDSIFCNNCTEPLQTNFSLANNNQIDLLLEQVLPTLSQSTWDYSCFNDSANMLSWHYRITNVGIGVIDSVWASLATNDLIQFLGLVPQSSFSYDVTCIGCVDSVSLETRTNNLCSNYISDALLSAFLQFKNFTNQDTLNIYFETFRCADSSASLFNTIKSFNDFVLKVTGKGICGASDSMQINKQIAGLQNNNSNDMDLNTFFAPVVSDLSVPGDSVFGQTTTLEIEFKGGIAGIDLQLLGCDSLSCTQLQGYLKAEIVCEKGLVVRNPSDDVFIKLFNADSADFIFLNPVYYQRSIPPDTCLEGNYAFYFDLSNNAFKNVLDSGIFEFELQACCDVMGVIDYKVQFSIMPDPNNCDSLIFPIGDTLPPSCSGIGCTWIPLQEVESNFSVHCPGCVTPGMIVDNYLLRRTTFGLQDANNNGLADSGSIQITPGTPWFDSHNIKTWHSTIGDGLEDIMVSHFQEGDASTTGYTYQQMLDSAGVRLSHLQLNRIIPKGLDTMQVTPISFNFYIDEPDTISPYCVDCELYSVNTSRFRTVLALEVPDSMLSLFLDLFPTDNAYLFSFETYFDSLMNQYSGNLHQYPGLISHMDTVNPFIGFLENQQYRLKVVYRQCGTKITSYSNLNTLSDISLQSEVRNTMWLSGVKQNFDAYSNIPLQPPSLDSLHNLGWTLNPNDPDTTRNLIDSTFVNQYIFYCTGYGRFHYFFFQNVVNSGSFANIASCNKELTIKSRIQTKGTNILAFPFEYRPTPLWTNQIEVNIPLGYQIIQSRYRSKFNWSNFENPSQWISFQPPQIDGNFTMQDSTYMQPTCFVEPYNGPPADTLAFTSTEYSALEYEFLLAPITNCIQLPLTFTDSSVMFHNSFSNISCIDSATAICQPEPEFIYPSSTSTSSILVTYPNLDAYFTTSTVYAYNRQVCFEFVITNSIIPIDSSATVSTGAPNVFLTLPDSVSYPFLQNWIYLTSGGDTIVPSGQILQLDNWLEAGDSLSGTICATYNPCQDTVNVSFNAGWNCTGFPNEPYDPDSVCTNVSLPIEIIDLGVNITSSGKQYPGTYTLCSPFEIWTNFASEAFGEFIPTSFSLGPLANGLIPLYALISDCDGNSFSFDTLQLQAGNTWTITANNLQVAGISDSALNELECIKITLGLLPQCEFAGVDSLPAFILSGQTFCGDTMSHTENFQQGSFEQDTSSLCEDCFTIEKMVLQDTVYTGDTTSFQIVICGNNDSTYSVIFQELLPEFFIVTNSLPISLSIPGQACDTVLVSGYYSQPGNCNDTAFINTAQIITAHYDTISDSACITVLDSCIAFSSQVVPDSAYSSNYGGGFSNTIVYISGVFFIDSTFTLTNCTAYTSSSAQIIILPGEQLIIDSSSVILGCSTMWPGIVLDTTAKISMINQSRILDANVGILAGFNSTVEVENCYIYDCIIGIYAPPTVGMVNTNITVRGSKIGLNAPALKPNYFSQPVHGVIPKAGMELHNMVMVLGGTTGSRNEFFKMNTGVVAVNSNLVVRNSEFYHIGYDTAYSEPYRGTALVARVNEGYSGRLTVMPEPTAYYAVHNCHRAIYTDRAVLSANYVHLIDVYHGIYGKNTPTLQTSTIIGCTITTATYGIFWENNPQARFMNAQSNHITVNASIPLGGTSARGLSKAAIYMGETGTQPVVYSAIDNTIELNNAHFGVVTLNASKANIKFNRIKINTASAPMSNIGIGVYGSKRSQINCNSITGSYPSSGNQQPSIGILSNLSIGSSIGCNSVDSTHRGFYFGGFSPQTKFKGNELNRHAEGLYLNNVAVIDTQPYHGNIWLDTCDLFAANNANINPQSNVRLSLFIIDSLSNNSLYPPSIPGSNAFWFDIGGGNTFSCSTSTVCEYTPSSISSNELAELIASGMFETEDYTEESRAIAEGYLYEELMRDSSLWIEDSLYLIFISENMGETIGLLYETEENLRIAGLYDSVFTALIDSAYTQIDAMLDSIAYLDLMREMETPLENEDILREKYLFTIDFLNQTIENLLQIREVYINDVILEAELNNSLVIPVDLPDVNAVALNDINIELLEAGGNLNVVRNRFSELWTIANQCPFAGGISVYKARAMIAMINDSAEYFDDNICLQSGIYREQVSILENSRINEIEIIPNPANHYFEVILNNPNDGICNIIVANALNEIVISDKFNCDDKKFKVNSSHLAPGAYYVTVRIDKSITQTKKLIILK